MNRRGFLRFLGAATAVALDPERALWVPGAKLISIPRSRPEYMVQLVPPEEFTAFVLATLQRNLALAKIGDTIFVRRPQRFIVRG